MKASQEVLQKYAAGERNFQRLNLRGKSFKGKDLAGVNFSQADIRSANFAGANLREANFTGAKCGLQKRWAILLTIPVWLLACQAGKLVGGVAGIGVGAVVAGRSEAAFIAGLGVGAIAIAVAIAIAIAGTEVGAGVGAIAVAITIAAAGAGVGAIAGVVAGAGVYIGWHIMKVDRGYGKYANSHSWIVDFAGIGGTNFRGADLTGANFTEAQLKSADFRKANLTHVCWDGKKMQERVRPGGLFKTK